MSLNEALKNKKNKKINEKLTALPNYISACMPTSNWSLLLKPPHAIRFRKTIERVYIFLLSRLSHLTTVHFSLNKADCGLLLLHNCAVTSHAPNVSQITKQSMLISFDPFSSSLS